MGIKLSDYIKDIETLFTEEEIIDIFERAKRDYGKDNDEYYFITYTEESEHESETINKVIGESPLEWLTYKNKGYYSNNYTLLFYQKITEEEYSKYEYCI